MRTPHSALVVIFCSCFSPGCGAASGDIEDEPPLLADADAAPAPVDGFVLDALPHLDASLDGADADGVCRTGLTRACYPGDAKDVGRGRCVAGVQRCLGSGELGAWGACEGFVTPSPEVCGNALDDDCDGEIDEGCVIDVPVDIKGDCVTVSCPPEAPYPIGCDIKMSGGDARGCVAWTKGSSTVFFKEGNECGAGYLTGTLKCSSVESGSIDAKSCIINKATKYYVASPKSCPT